MKKILSILVFLCAGTLLFAGPADPSEQQYRQPDGSVVRYFVHGDEYLSWMTDLDGNVIEFGEDGFIHAASMPSWTDRETAATRRAAAVSPRVGGSKGLTGNRKFCVILVEFADIKFTKTKDDFDKFFNGTGSASGSTGSVREYWEDQSDGKLHASFDIYGPYTMDSNAAYYPTNWGSSYRESIVVNVFRNKGGEEDIDFSKYKNGKTNVESIIMIFAGYSAASIGRNKTIWPAQGNLSYYSDDGGGVNVVSYCCGPELQGSSGSNLAGIGHICHELGHCFGLPDIYDTDRDSHSSTAKAPTYHYSLMDYGSYTNSSKTPPPLSIMEKYLCGWVSNLTSGSNGEIATVTSSGAQTLYEIGQGSNPRALRIDADGDDEFFLCEFRSINSSVNKWGAKLPKGGMIVYHVDMGSDNWTSSTVNNDPSHPCFYLVNASDPDSIPLYSNANSTSWAMFPFPGNGNVRSFNPHGWNGLDTYVSVTGMPTIGATSTNTSLAIKTHVRTFPLINNPGKGVYASGDKFYLKLSNGYGDDTTVNTWKFNGEETTAEYVTLTSGTHTIEAVLSSGKRLRLEMSVK